MPSESLIYLYGVVPASTADPPDELRGIDGAPVRVLRRDEVAAVVSQVDAETYSDEPLNARLDDLAWVGDRGLAHERVLDWLAEQGPVIPLSLFSLHRGEERVRERLAADAERFVHLLEQLRGRREWGIKLWRHDEQLSGHLDELSPTLRALSEAIAKAPPGKQFLLNKKLDAVRTDELRSVSKRVAHQAYGMLQEAAERATSIALPAASGEGGRALLLHAAFLVADAEYAAFQRRVGEVAHEFGGYGFEVEFTGPWPPYHFADLDVG